MRGILLFAAFVMVVEAATRTSHTDCYEKGDAVQFGVTCPSTKLILIHSVESQSAMDCSSKTPTGSWSSPKHGYHEVFSSCNQRKEKCIAGKLRETLFLRIHFTCVDLSSIRRYDMCANVTSRYGPMPIYLASPGYPGEQYFYRNASCYCHIAMRPGTANTRITLHTQDMFISMNVSIHTRDYVWPLGDDPNKHYYRKAAGYFKPADDPSLGTGQTLIPFNTNHFYVRFTSVFSGKAYFWMVATSDVIGIGSWAVSCNNGEFPPIARSVSNAPQTHPNAIVAVAVLASVAMVLINRECRFLLLIQ